MLWGSAPHDILMGYRVDFVPVQAGGWNYRLLPALAEPSFLHICALPSMDLPEGVVPVVSSPNSEVRKFYHQGRGYFLKEYFFLGWKKHLKVLRRGERLVDIAAKMEQHGFSTPRIVGIGRNGKNRRVVSEAVEDARDVWQVLYPDFVTHRGAVEDGFLLALGRTIGRFHACGFCHGDLRWRNILVVEGSDGWTFYFIDNDRTRHFRLGLPFRCRVKNLSQILFSGLLVNWPESEWRVFLQGYSQDSDLSPVLHQKLIARVEARAGRRLSAREAGG